MKHLKPINRTAERIDNSDREQTADQVFAMDPVYPAGCTTALDPGVEVDVSGGVSALCIPWEADLYGCSDPCYWPASIPDTLSHPDWSEGKTSGQNDWRELEPIYPKR